MSTSQTDTGIVGLLSLQSLEISVQCLVFFANSTIVQLRYSVPALVQPRGGRTDKYTGAHRV